MKRNKNRKEQFHKADFTEQELEETFTLEDILREFGSHPEPEPAGEEPLQEPVKADERGEQAPERCFDGGAAEAETAPSDAPSPVQEPEDTAAQAKPTPQEPERAKLRRPRTRENVSAPQTRMPPARQADNPPRRPAQAAWQAETASPVKQPPVKKTDRKEPERRPTQPRKQPREPEPPDAPLAPEELCADCMQRLGASRLRLVFCGILAVLSVLLVVYQEYQLTWIPFLNGAAVIGGISLALWALCAVLAFDVLAVGVRQIVTLHFRLEALLTVAAVLTAADGVLALREGRFPYCAVSTLELTFGLWGLSDGLLGSVHTLRVVQAADQPKAVVEAPEAWNGQNGLFRGIGDKRQFMESYQENDLMTRAAQIYAPVMLVLSLAAAIYCSSGGEQSFVRIWMVLLYGATPLCGFISYARPFCLLANQLAKAGGALCGWAGAKIFGGRHTVLLRDEDVFPRANVSPNGIKLYGRHSIDRVAAYAAAVTDACGSTLAPLFEELRAAQNCRHYSVRKYRYYEGGIGAEMMDDVVLMGSLRFMNSMGVHMDAGMKVKQAVYLSINGELAGVFAMKYAASSSVGSGLAALVHSGNFDTVLAARDFLVTPEYLHHKYGIPEDSVIYPQVKERLRLSEQDLTKTGRQGAILTKDSFVAFAKTVSGGRALRTSVQAGTVLALLSGGIGFLLMLLLVYLGAINTASVFNVTLFLLVWALPGLLLSRWTKRG